MCERLKQAVLKTALPVRVTGVRIPLPPPFSPYYPVTYEKDANCSLFCGLSRDSLSEAEPESYLRSPPHRELVAFSLIGASAVRFRAQSAPESLSDCALVERPMCEQFMKPSAESPLQHNPPQAQIEWLPHR
jgi:hypothetical protein